MLLLLLLMLLLFSLLSEEVNEFVMIMISESNRGFG